MSDKKTKKPLKRIELKKHSKNKRLRLRASRTGGLAGSYHPVRGVTFSSRYGLRASKTLRGLTLGFQGKRLVFRGRWSAFNGLFNLNLSKSGLTFSSKSRHGTYNFSRPNRSSFKFAGIQIRGKKAAGPALLLTIFTLSFAFLRSIPDVILFVFNLIVLMIKMVVIASDMAITLVKFVIYCVMYLLLDLPLQLHPFKKGLQVDAESEQFLSSDKSFAIDGAEPEATDLAFEPHETTNTLGTGSAALAKQSLVTDQQIAAAKLEERHDLMLRIEELENRIKPQSVGYKESIFSTIIWSVSLFLTLLAYGLVVGLVLIVLQVATNESLMSSEGVILFLATITCGVIAAIASIKLVTSWIKWRDLSLLREFRRHLNENF